MRRWIWSMPSCLCPATTKIDSAMRDAIAEAHRLGLTGVHDFRIDAVWRRAGWPGRPGSGSGQGRPDVAGLDDDRRGGCWMRRLRSACAAASAMTGCAWAVSSTLPTDPWRSHGLDDGALSRRRQPACPSCRWPTSPPPSSAPTPPASPSASTPSATAPSASCWTFSAKSCPRLPRLLPPIHN